jgi:hypothetical protein
MIGECGFTQNRPNACPGWVGSGRPERPVERDFRKKPPGLADSIPRPTLADSQVDVIATRASAARHPPAGPLLGLTFLASLRSLRVAPPGPVRRGRAPASSPSREAKGSQCQHDRGRFVCRACRPWRAAEVTERPAARDRQNPEKPKSGGQNFMPAPKNRIPEFRENGGQSNGGQTPPSDAIKMTLRGGDRREPFPHAPRLVVRGRHVIPAPGSP